MSWDALLGSCQVLLILQRGLALSLFVSQDGSLFDFQLTFYYGAADAWCPVQYYEEMKTEFPEGDIRLCEKGIRHAFVLEASKEVAEMVVDWLQDDLSML